MKKLEADFDYREYATAYLYCTVFPIEKTKNGFYKCHLRYGKFKNKVIEWVIPAEYLEENGVVSASKDVFFARWLMHSFPDLVRNEEGEPIKYENGYHVVTKLKLGRLIEFWNTRVFGEGSEPFKTAKKDG